MPIDEKQPHHTNPMRERSRRSITHVRLDLNADWRSYCHFFVRLPVRSHPSVQDILVESRKSLQQSWGISGALRLLEVMEGRLHKHHRHSPRQSSETVIGDGV